MALMFLSDAYKKTVRAKYNNSSPQDLTKFQGDQLVNDELSYLTLPVTLATVEADGEAQADLSVVLNLLAITKISVKTYDGVGFKWNSPTYKTLDTVSTAMSDPFNKPTVDDPLVYFEENKIKIPLAEFTAPEVKVSYIILPADITLVEEYTASFMDEVVDLAAGYILESWKDQRVSTKTQLDMAASAK
jgi:hypothetical protein